MPIASAPLQSQAQSCEENAKAAQRQSGTSGRIRHNRNRRKQCAANTAQQDNEQHGLVPHCTWQASGRWPAANMSGMGAARPSASHQHLGRNLALAHLYRREWWRHRWWQGSGSQGRHCRPAHRRETGPHWSAGARCPRFATAPHAGPGAQAPAVSRSALSATSGPAGLGEDVTIVRRCENVTARQVQKG